MAVVIQLRRDQSTNWSNVNPTLAEGEIGIELDTAHYKMGDGVTAWNTLAYGALGAGVPTSGSLNQTLYKLSTTDYDTAWQNHSTRVLFDFGSAETHNATLTVNSTWVTANTNLFASLAMIDTSDHLADEGMVEGVSFYPTSNVTAGISYEIAGFSPLKSHGKYYINIKGE